jgi:hypothetical protein
LIVAAGGTPKKKAGSRRLFSSRHTAEAALTSLREVSLRRNALASFASRSFRHIRPIHQLHHRRRRVVTTAGR